MIGMLVAFILVLKDRGDESHWLMFLGVGTLELLIEACLIVEVLQGSAQ